MTFVVTLELDAASFSWLNDLRTRHFPADRNLLDAHLTLFHTLDDDGLAVLTRQCADELSGFPLPLTFSGVRSLGRGVAIEVTSPQLLAMHARLASALAGHLTRQDAQTLRPHVTVQNKVEPLTARASLAELRSTFAPRTGHGIAIQVWDYLGGPWRLSQTLTK